MLRRLMPSRRRDPAEFEERRKTLAHVLKVPYKAGYMQVYFGDQGGRDHWVSGVPSDDQVAECMAPTYPVAGGRQIPHHRSGRNACRRLDTQSLHSR